jgi:hypothetical protein
MSIAAYVIAEGPSDVKILTRCLPESIVGSVKFIAGQGKYSGMSLAATILTTRRVPIVLVEDADTLNEEGIKEREDFLRYILQQAAAGVPFQVLMVVPEIEVLFFEDRAFIERFTGQPLSDREWHAAKRDPKEWLAGTLAGRPIRMDEILAALSDKEFLAIRQHPLINGLSDFIASVASREAAAVPG